MATKNLSLRSEGIQDRAYLSIGVTSSSGAALNGAPGEGDFRGIGAVICKILQVNFYEKALFVKGRRGGRPVMNTTALCPSRYASIRAL
jgi:hypothetical protein